MTVITLMDATTWVDGLDLTGDSNKIQLAPKTDDLDVTAFRSGGYRRRIGGLRTVEATVDGYWSAPVDNSLFAGLGSSDRVVTMSVDGTAGSVAYLFQASVLSYDLGDQVGAALPFSLDLAGSSGVGLVRGRVAVPTSTITTAGPVGQPVTLGQVQAGQHVYATVHVFTAGALTLDVEADSDPAFSAPTTLATIGPLTTTGGVWIPRVPGPVTGTWYRIVATDVTGSPTVGAALAIQ